MITRMDRFVALGLALCLPLPAAAETRWFVVAEELPDRGDAFLIPISDPELIEEARALVEQGPGNGKIISAAAVAGSDGFNRNPSAEGEPLWHWHVARVDGFTDFAIELCDGSPTLLEADVDGFLANTQGQICFWGYRVVAELEATPTFRINRNLSAAWYDPATAGQGMLVDVDETLEFAFTAWFTFETAEAKLGAPEHRWLTAQGNYEEDRLSHPITLTRGGRFDDAAPVEQETVGQLSIQFTDCNHARAEYQFEEGPAGTIELQRLIPKATCGSMDAR